MQTEKDRAGRFFLKQRGREGTWYICWYDSVARQTDRISIGTADREAARTALYEHALKYDRPPTHSDAQLAHVMQACWVNYTSPVRTPTSRLSAMRSRCGVT